MRTHIDSLQWIEDELVAIRAKKRERIPVHLSSGADSEVELEGRRLIHLCSNNYLGLATHPDVVDAAIEATKRFGTGSGASRLVSGGFAPHRALEERLAQLKGTEDAILFSSGYLANAATVAALARKGDVVLSDALNHASVVDGCRLSGARVLVYAHRDTEHLEDLMRDAATTGGRILVVTDTVFSMDGDLAPLAEIARICDRYGAMLMTDEAHATGVLGPNGAGAVADAGLTEQVPIVMGTLSKALGAAGGFIAGSRSLTNYLRNRARGFIFDTAPPPAPIAAALAAIDVVEREPVRVRDALANARALAHGIRSRGYDVAEPVACIVPVMLGDEANALACARRLLERGVLAPAIRPPSVPEGACRVRVTAMATHTPSMITAAIEAFEQ